MRSPLGLLAALALLMLPQGIVARQEAAPRSSRTASYTIDATLDPGTRTIAGRGRLVWRNAARVPRVNG